MEMRLFVSIPPQKKNHPETFHSHPRIKPEQPLEKPKTNNQTVVGFRVSVMTVIIWQVIFFQKRDFQTPFFETCLCAFTSNDDVFFIDNISLQTINVIDPFQPANDGI